MESMDLLYCDEDIGSSSSSPCKENNTHFSDIQIHSASKEEEESCISKLCIKLREHAPNAQYYSLLTSNLVISTARSNAVHWIFKVCKMFGFSMVTICLSVNYLDRYLSKDLPHKDWQVWMVELLSVTCLFIAAKVEESCVPTIDTLQKEPAINLFNAKTVQRMERLILKVLDWRMNAVTSFSFAFPLINMLDIRQHSKLNLLNRLTELLLATLPETAFLEFSAAEVAASATVCAVQEILPLQTEVFTPKILQVLHVKQVRVEECCRKLEELVVDPLRPVASCSQVLSTRVLCSEDYVEFGHGKKRSLHVENSHTFKRAKM